MPTWSTPPTFTDGQIVTASGLNTIRDDLLVLRSNASCRVSAATAQSFPNAAWTAITLPTEDWDPHGWHAPGAAAVVPTTPGYYSVVAGVEFANNSTGVRGLRISLNDVDAKASVRGQVLNNAVTGFATHLSCAALVRVNDTTDQIIAAAFQNSGGALPATGGGALTLQHWMSVTWIGA